MAKSRKPTTSKSLAQFVAKIADEKIAKDILILNLSKIHVAPSDYFVICTCESESHMKAIVDSIEMACVEVGIKRPRVEGFKTASWIILDFFDVVVHLLRKESREFYNLERIWNDAQFFKIDDNGKVKELKPKNNEQTE